MNTRLTAGVWASTLLACAGAANAELIFYDGFDYGPGGPLQTNAGGEGNWEGEWFSSTYIVGSGSLMIPNMPFDVVGGHTDGAGTANRDITEISTATPGTYYLSYLTQRTGYVLENTSGQWADFYLRDGFTQVVNGGLTSSSNFHVRYVGGDTGTSAGQGADSASPFFVVYKLVIGDTSGSNSMSMSWYSDGSAIPVNEPASWDLQVTGQSVLAGNFNKLTLWSGTNLGFSAQYDELRMATTYAEAVPIDAQPIVGDLDGDGFVGISDLNLVLGNWNLNVPPADPASDPSGDDFVGIADLNFVLGNWNAGTPPTGASAVPEPTAATIATLAVLGVVRRRRA
jgi:hypothetical protein